MSNSFKIYVGDSREVLKKIPDNSVHLVVTSPPYSDLKDYGHDKQIGYGQTFEQYISDLNVIWKECYRVLKPGCRMCINIYDPSTRTKTYGRHKRMPIKANLILYCESIGFDYLSDIFWHAIKTCNPAGGSHGILGSFPYGYNGYVQNESESILIFKKLGDREIPPSPEKEASALTTKEWRTYFCDYWKFATVRQDDHIAKFPEELPHRLIKMYSFRNEVILDPFLGSGTTLKVARELQRSGIGIELNPDYLSLLKGKIGYGQSNLSQTANEGFELNDYEIIKEEN